MKIRQLTSDEQKQLNITKLFHEKRLTQGFNWKKFSFVLCLEILFIIIVYHFSAHTSNWIAQFGAVLIPIYLGGLIKTFIDNRKQSNKLLKIINKIITNGGVEVEEYHCRKAIAFPECDGEGHCHALEVGANQLLFWWDSEFWEIGLLPNSKFEVYEDEDVILIFGKRLNILGTPFQAITIRSEIKWDYWDFIPEHEEILNSTVDEFLEKIEAKYKS